ncbi:MAG TPA: hypothetical protein VFB07_07475 [Vicinamibacterales bacterium]|nr:hypothetical protein [Vicinamibacterales bacterium]
MLPLAIAATLAMQGGLDRTAVDRFVAELRRAVAAGDRAAVAARVQYPITVFAGGMRIPIADAAALGQSYAVIFTSALTSAIARDAPIVSGDTATIGAGAIEIRRIGGALEITRITVPVGGGGAAARSDARGRGASPPADAAPDRIGIDVGRAQRAGSLAPGARASYVVFVPKNRLLDVRIEGVRGRDVVARIVRATDGAPVDPRAKDGVRTWSGRVPEDGDYRIEVVRRSTGADRQLFTLIVTLR